MTKSIFTFVLLQVLIFFICISILFTGCSKGKANDANNKDIGLKGNLELQIFTSGYGDEWWKQAIEGFKKKNPDLNVVVDMGYNVNTQMNTRWVTNNPPDFVNVDGPGFPTEQLAANGKLMDLKNWFDETKAADGKSIREHLMKGFVRSINGKEYFAPYILSPMALFYNENMLKSNGLNPPNDFNEFIATGKALKSKGISLMVHSGMYPVYLWKGFIFPALVSEGGEQFLNDVLNCKPGIFKSQAFVNTIKKVETLQNDGLVLDGTVGFSHIQAQKKWLEGKAAFIPNGMWLAYEMRKDIPEGFSMKFTPAPLRSKGHKAGLFVDGVPFAISSASKNPVAAKAWLKYLYSEEQLKKFVEMCGAPTVYSIDMTGIKASELVRSVMEYLSNQDVLVIPASDFAYPEVGIVANLDLTSLITGEKSAEEYCNDLQNEVDKIVKGDAVD